MAEFNKDIFKISKDKNRAKDLFEMALERKNKIISSLPKELPYKILEEYYEIAVQLITSLMYSEGYKTLSHISLIKFLSKYKKFGVEEISILDKVRKFRHGTVYYGRKESGNFFINHEEDIENITNKLFNLVKKEVENE